MAKSIDTLNAKVHNLLKKTGDAMVSGFLTLFQDPVEPLHAVTKRYVDALFGSIGGAGQFLAIITQSGLATTTSQLGLVPPTVAGAATSVDDATGAYINYASTTTAGWTFTVGTTEQRFLPDTTWIIKTPVDITDIRLWVTLCGANISAADIAAGGTNIIGFNFSTVLGHTAWQARCDRNGVGGTIVNTGVTVVADTRYVMRADASTDGTVRFYINGALVTTISTNLPLGSAQLSIVVSSGSTSGVSKSIRIRRVQQTSF